MKDYMLTCWHTNQYIAEGTWLTPVPADYQIYRCVDCGQVLGLVLGYHGDQGKHPIKVMPLPLFPDWQWPFSLAEKE